jgi:ADP-ribose pyrophosphatase YjhB (NUDIX family)
MSEPRLPHGANVIVKFLDKYLISKRLDGRLEITGGGLERNERPDIGGAREPLEELDLMVFDLRLIGVYNQRVPGNVYPFGFVFLFETESFALYVGEEKWDSARIIKEKQNPIGFVLENLKLDTTEVSEVRFMTLEEIISEKDDFGDAYLRMILRSVQQVGNGPDLGFLSEQVTFQGKKY